MKKVSIKMVNPNAYEGNKGASIKTLRSLTSLELKEAKEIIERVSETNTPVMVTVNLLNDDVALSWIESTFNQLGFELSFLDSLDLDQSKKEIKELAVRCLERDQYHLVNHLMNMLKDI